MTTKIRYSAEATAGDSLRRCPQCCRDRSSLGIFRSNGNYGFTISCGRSGPRRLDRFAVILSGVSAGGVLSSGPSVRRMQRMETRGTVGTRQCRQLDPECAPDHAAPGAQRRVPVFAL